MDLGILSGLIFEGLGDLELQDVVVLEDGMLVCELEIGRGDLVSSDDPVQNVDNQGWCDVLVGFRDLVIHSMEDKQAKEEKCTNQMYHIESAEVLGSDTGMREDKHDGKDEEQDPARDGGLGKAPETGLKLVVVDQPDHVKGAMEDDRDGNYIPDKNMNGGEGLVKRKDHSERRVSQPGEEEPCSEQDNKGGVEIKNVSEASCNSNIPTHGYEKEKVWISRIFIDNVILMLEFRDSAPEEHLQISAEIEGEEEEDEGIGGEIGLEAGGEAGNTGERGGCHGGVELVC